MSHHSSNLNPPEEPSDFMKKLLEEMRSTGDPMRDLNRRIAGEFPNGKLNTQDEGAVALRIGSENGVVKLEFPKPVAWVAFTPDQAMELAQDLMKHARHIGLTKPFVMKI